MTPRNLSIALFTVLGIFLAGCGQKGGLYLPEPRPEPQAAETTGTPSEDNQDDDEGRENTP